MSDKNDKFDKVAGAFEKAFASETLETTLAKLRKSKPIYEPSHFRNAEEADRAWHTFEGREEQYNEMIRLVESMMRDLQNS